ncbi:MAG: hypothetical protein R2827_04985 [Bdellovibrionales bacterium]
MRIIMMIALVTIAPFAMAADSFKLIGVNEMDLSGRLCYANEFIGKKCGDIMNKNGGTASFMITHEGQMTLPAFTRGQVMYFCLMQREGGDISNLWINPKLVGEVVEIRFVALKSGSLYCDCGENECPTMNSEDQEIIKSTNIQ